jgi:hypothetical protein
MIRSLIFILAAAAASLALGRVAPAQCKDWAPVFALPGQGMNNLVADLEVFDDGNGPKLYATGEFTQAGGQPAAYIACWNGVQWSPVGTGLNSAGYALEVHSEGGGPASLYVGGLFTSAGGQLAEHVARWDGTVWHPVGGGFDNGLVHVLRSFNDGSGPKLYAGGQFTMVEGATANNIAVWDGVAWSTLGDGFNSTVNTIEVYDEGAGEVLFAAGAFTHSGPQLMRHIARWSGGAWTEPGQGILGAVYDLEVFDDGSGGGPKLWAGGQFDTAGGVNNKKNLAGWNGTTWIATAQGPSSVVGALEVFDDGILPFLVVGGFYTHVGGLLVNNIAGWNGSSWFALGPGLEPQYSDLVCQDLEAFNDGSGARLFAAGRFVKAGGKESFHIGRWNDPCSAPTITQQPQDQTAVFASTIIQKVKAHGTAPVQYQWRHNGVPIVDQVGILEGAQTDTLTHWVWSYSDHGLYDVEITNPFGTLVSQQAMLTVPAGGLSGVPVEVTVVLNPPAPTSNLPGSQFTNFIEALQCPTEEVIFRGDLDGFKRCLARWTSGPAEVLFKAGDPAPGLPGFTLGVNGGESIDAFVCASDGAVAFNSLIDGPGVSILNDTAIWHHDGSTTLLAIREGDQAAGMPAGVVHRNLSRPRMSENGSVVYSSETYSGGVFHKSGIWLWETNGTTSLLVETGSTAPGTSALLTSLHSSQPLLTPGGEVVFMGHLDSTTGWNYAGSTDSALWRGVPGNLQLIAKSGDPAPGMPAGTNLERFRSNETLVDATGRVVFATAIAGPAGFYEFGIYQWDQDTLTPIALNGQQAPGTEPGSLFEVPTPIALGGPDRVLFHSGLENACLENCPTEGLWLSSGGTTVPVAFKGGEPLPGLPPGFLLGEFTSGAVNDSGQVAFGCTMGYAGSGYAGVFGWSEDQGLYPIAVPGTQIELAPGVYKMVQKADLWPIANGFRESPNLSPSGMATLVLTFTDWTRVIAQGSMTLFQSLHFGSGIAYCFGDGTGNACTCGNFGAAGAGCANSTGEGTVLTATGSIEVSDDELTFTASDLPPNKVALLFEGTGVAGGGSGVLLGDGLRCVGGATTRIAFKSSGPLGFAQFGPGLAGPGNWQGGQTWNFQVWYRDPLGPCGVGNNLSNGYRVTFIP